MDDVKHLQHAARLALRGHGGAAPNPLVGCVIVSPDDVVVGWGYHRQCGGPHAEIHALNRAGSLARGATAYVTLEPCNHTGRTGPCAQALIDAGISRVVIVRPDPHAQARGGAQRLRDAGIVVDIMHCTLTNNATPEQCAVAIASMVSDPFVHRVQTGLPWVVVKWAQTLDGKIATRTGESQWISSAASRRMVHRERGRVDAILTGIGTAMTDDPKLTARHVRCRRIARRVLLDASLQIPLDRHLITHVSQFPTTIICAQASLHVHADKASDLDNAGVELIGLPTRDDTIQLDTALRALVERHEIANVLVEAGPGLVSRLFEQQLVNEAWVFVCPRIFGDEQAKACINGMSVEQLTDGIALSLIDQRLRGGDIVARYRVTQHGRYTHNHD